MAQNKNQTVRFCDETIQIKTVPIRGIECLRLEDVQRRFPSVTALCVDNVQLPFVVDNSGNSLEPLHVEACQDEVIEALAPSGFSNSESHEQSDRMDEKLDRLLITADRTYVNTQEILNQTRYMMVQMYELHEYTTPRYFFILPARHHDWAAVNTAKNLFQVHYKLYFLCECSDEPEKLHVAPHNGYSIKKPREFIARYGPYIRTTLRVVQVLLTIGGFVIPQLGHASTVVGNTIPLLLKSSNNFNNIKHKVEFVENLLDKTDTKQVRVASSVLQQETPRGVPLQGADLRELQSYLQLVDYKHSLGNLYRIVTIDGHVRWVCLEHHDAIGFNNKMSEYISQLEAIGGQFNQETKEAVIAQVNLTNKNVKMLCETLRKGFNIAKLIFKKCSFYEGDLDTLLDVIINRSSIHCLEMTTLDVRNRFGTAKYICQYMVVHFNNQSLKVRFCDHYQDGNAQMLVRFLLQNKIHQTLDFSACDFLGQEQEFRRCLDTNGILTGLIVKYSNNIDILNAIFTLKNNTVQHLKLNYSLALPSTSSRFCEILKKNQTLVEIDIMGFWSINNETFLIDLLNTLREHKSIKHLSLHVYNVKPSNQKEDSLTYSLQNDKFISRLCLSKSVISLKLTQALVYASQEHRSLTHLELYDNQINTDEISQLEALHKNDTLIHLIISERSPWHLGQEQTSTEFKKEQQLVSPNLNTNHKWKQQGTYRAGGHGLGDRLNQLSWPSGVFIDDDQTIYVADTHNHRIVEWKNDATTGQIIAGGNGRGNRNDQLNRPTNVLIDQATDSLIICDRGNRRVVRWPHRNGRSGETIISNIHCGDLIMDNDGFLYVSDREKHEVRRWKMGEKNGAIVAGGNGQGDRLDQLNTPYYIFVDGDQSVYVSDRDNHRVMKWVKGAKEGIVVAGGQGEGNGLRQLSSPLGIIVDQLGNVYVAERSNHRVMRWLKGAAEGTVVVGGNGQGEKPNQFSYPCDLSFDRDNNLYVVDFWNNRVVKFDVDSS